jgi:uncharacterized membrane protein
VVDTSVTTDGGRTDAGGISPARWVLILLTTLAAWEAGQVIATQLVVKIFAPNIVLSFGDDAGMQLETVAVLLLRVVIAFVVAAPLALLLLRPIRRGRASVPLPGRP